MNKPEYNDEYTGLKKEDIDFVKDIVNESGVELDDKLLFHISNIFKRDYIMAY